MIEYSFGIFVKVLIVLAPFFVLSVFAAITENYTDLRRRKLAIRTTISILITCLIFYFLGDIAFSSFGITLDAFRIGAGIVLFLSGLEMVRGTNQIRSAHDNSTDVHASTEDISVVPLTIPIVVGPGAIGVLITLSSVANNAKSRLCDIIGIILSILVVGLLLYHTSLLEKVLKKRGLTILSKLTGLFLVALATQIIMSGILGFAKGFIEMMKDVL